MRKLKLRGWVVSLLYTINFLICMFILMVTDFDLVGFIILMILLFILVINTYILYKFGGEKHE